jgi:hypothetical protein
VTKPKRVLTEEQRNNKNEVHRKWCATRPKRTRTQEQKVTKAASAKKWRAEHRLITYGLTQDQYDALLSAQDFRCAICSTGTSGGNGTWHIDHCHNTERVRGLLCSKCNTGLGLFNDSPAHLQTAITYLTKDLTK